MIASGKGAAILSTKSNSPEIPASATESMISTAMRSMSERRARTARGVKRRITTRRIGPCRGGSSIMTISGSVTAGASVRASMTPWAFEKRRGFVEICTMSACFVMAQNGRYPGGSIRAMGTSARSRVHRSWGYPRRAKRAGSTRSSGSTKSGDSMGGLSARSPSRDFAGKRRWLLLPQSRTRGVPLSPSSRHLQRAVGQIGRSH